MKERVYELKLELDISNADIEALKKYGKVINGISRTILVQSNMQLNALNYAIQKCFGFQNSHLHHFVFSKEKFNEITKNDFEEWKRYAGIYFRCNFEDEIDDLYYLDDFDGDTESDFHNWLKSKYSSKYRYLSHAEDIKHIKDNIKHINYDSSIDLYSNLIMVSGNELLEKLAIEDIIIIDDEFYYEYDFGDNWRIKISLIKEYTKNIDDELILNVFKTNCPICIELDGLSVFDDVGGASGFSEFLKGINGEENRDGYDKSNLYWARSLGFKLRMKKPIDVL